MFNFAHTENQNEFPLDLVLGIFFIGTSSKIHHLFIYFIQNHRNLQQHSMLKIAHGNTIFLIDAFNIFFFKLSIKCYAMYICSGML